MACCLLACLVLQSILLLTWASLNTICSVAQEQRFNGRLRVVVPPFYASNKQEQPMRNSNVRGVLYITHVKPTAL